MYRRIQQVRTISSNAGRVSVKPSTLHPTAVYIWAPGYSLVKELTQKNGSIKKEKVFVPTSTTLVAATFLLQHYGTPEAVLRHKHDIHPGHVALGIQDKYLSIGMADDLRALRPASKHKVVLSENLLQDTLGFERVPHCIDLHTLDTKKMLEFIEVYIKNPEKVYSILGSRLNLADGESCATVVHKALTTGGFDRLLNYYGQTLGAKGILTPEGLKGLCDLAKSTEHAQHPEIKPISEAFQEKYSRDMMVLSERFSYSPSQETPTSFKPRR
ncbi:MAG: hypothetical protein K2X50_03765 [Gammaproteobacteria bacterium]|nr:hypothetical protein [Gammaproteobacteria bacterium]